MNKVACIGELLIDFFCQDINVTLMEGKHFIKQAGGAPANVCSVVSAFGGEAYFGGKVGDDAFGHFLEATLREQGVHTKMLKKDPHHHTTFAFVSLDSTGERDFTFARGADQYYSVSDIDENQLEEINILHFGSATALLSDPFRKTYLALMEYGHKQNKFVSFDPNYRDDLWRGKKTSFIAWVKQCCEKANLVKVSEEELALITSQSDLSRGANAIHQLGAEIVMVTLGEKGTYVSTQNFNRIVKSINIKSIDSTGAGDAFIGALLSQLAKESYYSEVLMNEQLLVDYVMFSNVVAALVCTKLGGIDSIPTYDDVNQYLRK
ncbi:carbohydrate kinase family protein [Amphibacillus cookii]|uniref:carbohydrate kinase family protein n=1 Tax=Amphibacillus cookii TaxID=767787 RepID=UPI00195D7AA6|nr:carbohydrate kinase [Amphibacillus cookii]MBM7539892.1 fructokinase [Amphibacillus cookii]